VDNFRCKCKLLYLVCWTGYEGTDEETLWILVTELGNALELISDFHLAYPAKPGPLNPGLNHGSLRFPLLWKKIHKILYIP